VRCARARSYKLSFSFELSKARQKYQFTTNFLDRICHFRFRICHKDARPPVADAERSCGVQLKNLLPACCALRGVR
jgi:hypothetical protein